MKNYKNNTTILIIIAIIVIGSIFAFVYFTQDWGKTKDMINTEQSIAKLDKLYSGLNIKKLTPQKDNEYEDNGNYSVLPDISEYPFVVNPTTDNFLTIILHQKKQEQTMKVGLLMLQTNLTQKELQLTEILFQLVFVAYQAV